MVICHSIPFHSIFNDGGKYYGHTENDMDGETKTISKSDNESSHSSHSSDSAKFQIDEWIKETENIKTNDNNTNDIDLNGEKDVDVAIAALQYIYILPDGNLMDDMMVNSHNLEKNGKLKDIKDCSII